MSNESTSKWHAIREMWGGLGVFLIVALFIIISFFNGKRDEQIRIEKIRACSHAQDIVACIKSVN